MKQSIVPRAVAFAAAVAMVASSCSLLQVPNGVQVTDVQVDLAFGAQSPEPQPDFGAPGGLGPGFFPPAVLPPPILPPPPPGQEQDVELCPPTTAIGARDKVVTNIGQEHRPKLEDGQTKSRYPFSFAWNYEGDEEKLDARNRLISQVGIEGDGFQYVIEDPVSGLFIRFVAFPLTETSQFDGLYLRELHVPVGPPDPETNLFGDTVPYIPAREDNSKPGLRLLDFPVSQGSTVTDSAPDTALKDTGEVVQGPNGPQPVVRPATTEFISRMTVGPTELVQVCSELAQAWKVTWDLELRGDPQHRILGTFWLATQYGGWPVKDDFLMFGDLLNGNFSSNLMRLDPGRYL